MLVLSRRPGEKINIGDDIEIIVCKGLHDQVKLCIKAPKDIPVYRNEIYLAMKAGKSKEDRIKEKLNTVVTVKKGKLNNIKENSNI